MKLTKKITLALGVIAVGSASYAQTSAVASNGLIGTQYTEFSFGVQDVKHISDNAYSLGVAAKRFFTTPHLRCA